MKAAAVAYAARLGLSVFPVASDCRSPLLAKTETGMGGVHRASSDPAQVAAWWDRWPGANVALACGPVSNILALDVDRKAADGFVSLAALEAQHGALPATWRAQTPSGGEHVLFAHPSDRCPRNRVGFRPGLDIRAAGGSIAVAPSRRADGVYRWLTHPLKTPLAEMPAWLLAIIDPPPPVRRPSPPLRMGSADRMANYVASAINGECRAVACLKSGGRNAALFQASARLGELVGAGLVGETLVADALEEAAQECGLLGEDGPHSVRATIASGLRRGIARPREIAA